jgi:ring-1,2-phenylacetyl-CoA epoxidase subunit PaaE
MVEAARTTLTKRGVDDDVISDELFFSEPAPPVQLPAEQQAVDGVELTFTLDGRTSSVMVDPDGPPVLTYALEKRRDTPFSCRGGMCTTCKARVLDGEVRLDLNFALTSEDLERGYILTCQAHPISDKLTITYDV